MCLPVHGRSSPQRLSMYYHCCRVSNCKELTLIRDVRTRWNSTQEMVSRALLVKRAYNSFCMSESYMSPFALCEDDWLFLEQLDSLLRLFTRLTATLSSSTRYPSISRTVISYNRMMDHLEDFRDNTGNHEMLRNAADLGRDVLVKYYGRTDDTHLYSVATAMDPRARFHWWTVNRWEPTWVEVCKGHVLDAWEEYRCDPVAVHEQNPEVMDEFACYGITAGSPLEQDHLHQYTTAGYTLPNAVPDLELSFWKGQVLHWPQLSLMAKHHLAIPATSTPSERCFSAARLILPYTRNRLTSETIRILMLTDSWMKLGLEYFFFCVYSIFSSSKS